MSLSLFSRARRSATDIRRQAEQAPQESGEFTQPDATPLTPLSAEELRLVGGGEDTSPKGGWALPNTTSSTSGS